ncbi:Ophiobolin F synthase [Aspergillus granulosus]|uniref:Ophiobolin F synthase n=1 Tax=Aspergillus granulosus TaxID=176169 RepID=A0ABR4GSR1_9EURO
MEYRYSTVVDKSKWDPEGVIEDIPLRKHEAGDLEEVGSFRVQEDWRRLVGPVENPYRGSLGPEISFITYTVPECLPERLEAISYGLDYGFLHDDEIDTNIASAELDDVGAALAQGGSTGKIDEGKKSSGKRKMAAHLLREMMALDPERAMALAKSWAQGVQHSARRIEEKDWKSLDEYIPFRCMDLGYMHWHGLVTFGCAITVPEEEEEERRTLLEPAVIACLMTNDLFSYEKEKYDNNPQNAVKVIMKIHKCSEEEAKNMCKERVRVECRKYARTVKETLARTDISLDLKRYIEIMQYTVSGNWAWSTQCPRYHKDAKWNELQLLRAKHGIANHPARYSLKERANGINGVNGANGVNGTDSVNGINGKRKRNEEDAGDDARTNGNGVKKPAHILDSKDSFALQDVVALSLDLKLPGLGDSIVLQPYRYLTSLPSKGFRDQAIDSLNTWLRVPPESTKMIKEIIRMLHSASLMLDDIEDNSPLRRGKPSTHVIYGNSQTINSATYQYTEATRKAANLPNPASLRIFLEEIQQLYIGQSYDLYWTHNTLCPPIPEYLKMVDQKTGGLFRMLTRLMVAESAAHSTILDQTLNPLSHLIGRFFQIRDDYQNLASAEYARQKGYAEDLDEGKYSFTLIHCINTLEEDISLASEKMTLRAFLIKRRVDSCLTNESKREVLEIMKKTKSLEYTLEVLRALQEELEKLVDDLEAKFGEENFSLRMMLELLKV